MSKLGKVYTLCIRHNIKSVHPVVYMNKDYIYCKDHGCSELACYANPEVRGSITMSYAAFKEAYEQGNIHEDRMYTVYVPHYIKTFFEWIKEMTPEEKEIQLLKDKMRYLNAKIKSAQMSISRYEKDLDESAAKLVEYQMTLENLQKRVAEGQEV